MMIKEILEQHAMEVAFLWSQRAIALTAPHFDLGAIEAIDDRIEAHLDGIRVGGDEGWKASAAALAAEEPGEVFAAAVIAVEQGDPAKIGAVIDAAAGDPALARGIVAALGWASTEQAAPVLGELIEPARSAAERRIGIAGHAVHRRDPGAALTNALFEEGAPALEARALRAAGEIGRADLLPQVRAALGKEDGEVRFWAAWSGAILGEEAAIPALWAIVEEGGPRSELAAATASRRIDVRRGVDRLTALAADPARARAAIAGAGALGDPALVPLLLDQMSVPELARVAGEAFTTITGVRIERALAGPAPADHRAGPTDDAADEDVAMDPDEALPWPAPDMVARAWSERAGSLPRGVRHLLGAPMMIPSLDRALREGGQRHRAAAATEIAMRAPGKPLFEIRAPAARQRRALVTPPAPAAARRTLISG